MTARGPQPSAADRAVATILASLLAHVETARETRGLTVAGLAARAGLSKRAVISLRKLQVPRSSLHTLLRLTHAAGLRLDIRVRPINDSQSLDGDPHV